MTKNIQEMIKSRDNSYFLRSTLETALHTNDGNLKQTLSDLARIQVELLALARLVEGV
jgi:hypothetical protein